MNSTDSFHPKSIEKLKPSEYEEKIHALWKENRVYQPALDSGKPFGRPQGGPFYNLMMFPYPSAEGLHVGNMYAFTGADIYGRFKRMQGYDVFEPIGLDGFGIHSENYALKIGKNPRDQAEISEKNFYRQLLSIGNGFAWDNRLETYDPDYYKWTQWIFIQLFKRGLAYRKKSLVNFCPFCKTVLSDEQVIDGKCERCKNVVEKRDMEQWFFKITEYAEKLLQNTYKDDFHWPEKVKIGQRNWIGKKTGINITYPVVGADEELSSLTYQANITCFTTRPDTNFGATFVVLAPEHGFVKKIVSGKVKGERLKIEEIKKYVKEASSKSETERIAEGRKKTGVFTGFYALNQLNGYRMPIYISDFVLAGFGTGAVVGVPGHDLRDFEFAKEFGIPIIRVVIGKDGDNSAITKTEQVQEEEGVMVNSEFLNGMDIHKAMEKVMDYLEGKGWGKRMTTYRLRDWCVSRQRYWGAPIPMVYCSSCAEKGIGWHTIHKDGIRKQESRIKSQDKKDKSLDSYFLTHDSDSMPGWFPVPETDLPVLLPKIDDWKPEGTGKGPLAKVKEFVEITCPNCGGKAERETDVCDTFLDSAWYFLRYPSQVKGVSGKVKDQKINKNASLTFNLEPKTLLPWDKEITKKWLPVNMYIGGAEHTVLHLLYSRFVTMVFKDMGLLDFEEPYRRFFAHGLIIKDGAKMSKSKGNVVVPDEYIAKYGADTLRTYLMFLGPFDMGGDFRDSGIAGMYKFLSRVWRLVNEVASEQVKGVSGKVKEQKNIEESLTFNLEPKTSLDKFMHKTIKEVTTELEHLRYNTAIAKIMEYVNEMHNLPRGQAGAQCTMENIKTLLLLLAPFAPHMTEELWQKYKMGNAMHNAQNKTTFSSIHLYPWPEYDESLLKEDSVTIAIQINGKLRDTLVVSSDISRDQKSIETEVRKREKIIKYLGDSPIRKVIYVPGKILNFVI